MRTTLFLRLALATVLPLMVAFDASAQVTTVHSAGFETTTDNWAARGAATVARSTLQFRTGANSLRTTGRTLDWHGAAINATTFIEIGREYTISLWVWIDSNDPTANIRLSAQQPGGSNEFIWLHNIAAATTKQWVNLTATYTRATGVTAVTFYVESTNATLSFFIDDVLITRPSDPVPDPSHSCLVDSAVLSNNFEADALGKTYAKMGNVQPPPPIVVNDPQPPAVQGKVLEFKPGNTGHGNHGVLIPITLPSGRTLAQYTSISFKLRLSAGDLTNKTINIGAFQNQPPFANYSTANNIGVSASNATGGSVSNNWQSFSITTTNTSPFTGALFIYIGINNYNGSSGVTTWHLDDIVLNGPGPVGTGGCKATITGSVGYRMLSFPITGGKLADISDDTAIQGITGGSDPGSGSNVWLFNSGSSFTKPAGINTPFGDGYGFILGFFNNSVHGSSPLPLDLTVFGNEPAASVTVPLNPSSPFTLVGNPYASNYNTGAITAAGGSIHSVLQVWNGASYLLRDRTVPAERNISLFQGFWVYSGDGATSITLPKSGKTTTSTTGHFKSVANSEDMRGDLKFELTSETSTDQAIRLSFRENATLGWDVADASKFMPLLTNYAILSFKGNDRLQSVYSLPYNFRGEVTVDMQLDVVGVDGPFSLSWTGVETLPAGVKLVLLDNKTGQTYDVLSTSQATFNAASRAAKAIPAHALSNPELSATRSAEGPRFTLLIWSETTSVDGRPLTVDRFELAQNYPNPFNPTTQIQFTIQSSLVTRLSVYDLLGREVAVLVDGTMPAGSHQVNFDGSGLSSGIYVYRLEAGGQILTKRMTLIK